jgi:hypothetical protein
METDGGREVGRRMEGDRGREADEGKEGDRRGETEGELRLMGRMAPPASSPPRCARRGRVGRGQYNGEWLTKIDDTPQLKSGAL